VDTDAQLRRLLLADDFQFLGMGKLFSQGEAVVPRLVDALDDPDERVNQQAQLMLRLIGGERGIQGLHEWYERPRPLVKIINGPVPVPLREWDYKQVEGILSRPPRAWREDAVNYIFALAIDGSLRARGLLRKMAASISEEERTTGAFQALSDVERLGKEAAACRQGPPQVAVRRGAFFLTGQERSAADIALLAYAGEKHHALVSVSQTFGSTFLVVLRRVGTCWEYQSIAHYSTNN
jgi:hypothetical protein